MSESEPESTSTSESPPDPSEERLTALLRKIERGVDEPTNYTLFQTVVTDSISQLGLTPNDLARRFGCTVTTVSMWMEGAAMPHPNLRPAVYKYLYSVLTTGAK